MLRKCWVGMMAVMVVVGAALLTSGCKWDGKSLLGGDPKGPDSDKPAYGIDISDKQECKEYVAQKKVSNGSQEANCTSPDVPLDSFDVKRSGAIDLKFERMNNGGWPKVDVLSFWYDPNPIKYSCAFDDVTGMNRCQPVQTTGFTTRVYPMQNDDVLWNLSLLQSLKLVGTRRDGMGGYQGCDATNVEYSRENSKFFSFTEKCFGYADANATELFKPQTYVYGGSIGALSAAICGNYTTVKKFSTPDGVDAQQSPLLLKAKTIGQARLDLVFDGNTSDSGRKIRKLEVRSLVFLDQDKNEAHHSPKLKYSCVNSNTIDGVSPIGISCSPNVKNFYGWHESISTQVNYGAYMNAYMSYLLLAHMEVYLETDGDKPGEVFSSLTGFSRSRTRQYESAGDHAVCSSADVMVGNAVVPAIWFD